MPTADKSIHFTSCIILSNLNIRVPFTFDLLLPDTVEMKHCAASPQVSKEPKVGFDHNIKKISV